VTSYSGYGFTSFCAVDQQAYGVRPDGLYRLGGDTDNGALINGLIDFAMDDFGTATRKRVEMLYLGLATDGQVFVRLTGDNASERLYRATAFDTEYKVRTAKTDASRYWTLRFELMDASYADLDNIEWFVGSTGRRVGR
jgi:hypothetical protein